MSYVTNCHGLYVENEILRILLLLSFSRYISQTSISPQLRKQYAARVDDTIPLLFVLLFFLSSSYYHARRNGCTCRNFMTLHRISWFSAFLCGSFSGGSDHRSENKLVNIPGSLEVKQK
jgi:hypothetical protein